MFDIDRYREEIDQLCVSFGVKRLEVFGSAVDGDLNEDSDIDCLIEFDADGGNHFHRYFDLKYALQDLFGRRVDLIVDSAIRNPYFRKSVDMTRQLIYAA